jgi:hypothetical protein
MSAKSPYVHINERNVTHECFACSNSLPFVTVRRCVQRCSYVLLKHITHLFVAYFHRTFLILSLEFHNQKKKSHRSLLVRSTKWELRYNITFGRLCLYRHDGHQSPDDNALHSDVVKASNFTKKKKHTGETIIRKTLWLHATCTTFN